MAHKLFRNSMAYVGEVPWHGLGCRVPADATAEAMIQAANLNWEVRKERALGARQISNDPPTYERYQIVREPVGPETEGVAFAMVGSGYEPLQNRDAFSFFTPFIDNKWAEFHTAGALRQGERVWVLARLRGDIVVGRDDTTERFLLLSNSHDGSAAVTIRFTPIRVVCQNTLNLAMRGGSSVISIRHTKHVARNLAQARLSKLKRVVERVFADGEGLFGRMALHQMGAKDTNCFLEMLFPRTDLQKRNSTEPERWTRIKQILEDVHLTPPATRGTLWALYNAIVRDEDYRKSNTDNPDSRLDRVWFGSGNSLKLKALQAARQRLQRAA